MTRISGAWRAALLGFAAAAAGPAGAQTFRSHTRDAAPDQGVSEEQAIELTLTLVPATEQTLQAWIRGAGALDGARHALAGCAYGPNAALVQAGDRVRAFPPDSRASIYQATVTRATTRDDCTFVEAELSGPAYGDATRFVMEIIVNQGEVLSIPNSALIERDDKQIVYVEQHASHYEPREVHIGRRGEIYAEVLDGLDEGERVVNLGSFFIDADYRLKTADAATEHHATDNAHEHH